MSLELIGIRWLGEALCLGYFSHIAICSNLVSGLLETVCFAWGHQGMSPTFQPGIESGRFRMLCSGHQRMELAVQSGGESGRYWMLCRCVIGAWSRCLADSGCYSAGATGDLSGCPVWGLVWQIQDALQREDLGIDGIAGIV